MINQRYAIGVDLGATNIRVALLNNKGEIVRLLKERTQRDKKAEFVLDRLVNLIEKAIKNFNSIEGIGVACPGPLNSEKGIIYSSPNLPQWHNVELVKYLSDKLKMDVYLENDADLAALGECYFGEGKNWDNFIYITVGSGVGSGVILNRKIYKGVSGIGAEIGHITIERNGLKCGCGNYGCLEAYASGGGMVNLAKHKYGIKDEKITAEDIAKLANKGDDIAIKIIQEAGESLGIGLASVVNIFNPGLIILSGSIVKIGELYIEPAMKELRKRAFPVQSRDVKIVISSSIDTIGVIGAGILVFLNKNIKILN